MLPYYFLVFEQKSICFRLIFKLSDSLKSMEELRMKFAFFDGGCMQMGISEKSVVGIWNDDDDVHNKTRHYNMYVISKELHHHLG